MAQDDRDSTSPAVSPQEAAAREARAQRLAAALRDNLRRRKSQARGRRAMEGQPAAQASDSAAEQATDDASGGGSNGA